jgi:hypothetical protein
MSPLEQVRVLKDRAQTEVEQTRQAPATEERGQLCLPRIPLPVQRPMLNLRLIRRIAYV